MYTSRHIESRCRNALKDGKVLVLVGPRQTGKSTLALRLMDEEAGAEHVGIDLDDPFLRDRLLATERGLIREIEERLGRPLEAVGSLVLLIDEAQKAPSLFESVKQIHDTHSPAARIILTGSSALEIHDPVAESLAGRARIIHLSPFTLSEGFAHAQMSDPSGDGLVPLMSDLLCGRFDRERFEALRERARWSPRERRRFVRDHLRFPLFPEPCAASEPEEWIRDYLATYLEKDVQSLAAVGNLALFRACLRQVAARVASPVKWEPMAQEIGTTSVTLRRYVGLLEQTLTAVRLGPFATNPVKRVVRAPKLYYADAGLLWGLRGYEDERLLEASGMLGAYAEQAGIVEIAKWCALEPTAPELRFWAKTAVSEVDLIVSNRGYHIPFEIKLGERFDPRWLRGFAAFEADHEALGLVIPYRIVLSSGDLEMPDERTFVLPLWALA